MRVLLRYLPTLLAGILVGAFLFAQAPELVRTGDAEPPVNFVAVTDRIHTAGQPSNEQLALLNDKGYGLVINLAPPTAFGSIADEGLQVARAGISYLNIPVDWQHPRPEDFELFSGAMRHADTRRILVHCQANMRASLFTFLYRVIHEGADPDAAFEKVTAIWTPEPQWTTFARQILQGHGIDYELL